MGQEDTATDAPVGTTQAPAAAGPAVLRLCGRHTNGIDAKARVVMPASFRPAFAGGGLLTVWQDRCLAAFPLVEVTGTAAICKVELTREGKLAFTDYLQLYRFADGWKIVGKSFYRHP